MFLEGTVSVLFLVLVCTESLAGLLGGSGLQGTRVGFLVGKSSEDWFLVYTDLLVPQEQYQVECLAVLVWSVRPESRGKCQVDKFLEGKCPEDLSLVCTVLQEPVERYQVGYQVDLALSDLQDSPGKCQVACTGLLVARVLYQGVDRVWFGRQGSRDK